MLARVCVLLFGTVFISGNSAIRSIAAEQPIAAEKLVVDVVTLKSGIQYRGAVVGRDHDGAISMVVQRDWLKRQNAKEFESIVANEAKLTQAAAEKLVGRIQDWLKQSPEPANLKAFLELELERAERLGKGLNENGKPKEPPQFVWLSVAENKVRTTFLQPPATRKWAALAWQQRLADVERRSSDDLRKTLAAKGITADTPADLSDRLPLQSQLDDEWAARRALIEAQYGRRVEFQGLGDAWVRTDGNAAKADWKQLLPTILQSQLQAQLGDLLGGLGQPSKATTPPALSKAIEQADEAQVSGFRVTELKLDIERRKATVTTKFVARLAPSRWDVIWQHVVEEDGSKARPEVERRIETDPQVKEVLGVLKGLDAGGGDAVTSAIRVGAAVMTAQQAANAEYQQFVGQYSRHLDGPPLRK